MLTFLTLVLWFGGLVALLAGHLFIGAGAAMLGVWTSSKALSRRDDMESFFGMVFGLLVLLGAFIAVVETWRWFQR